MANTTPRPIPPLLWQIGILFFGTVGAWGAFRAIHQITHPSGLWLARPALMLPCALLIALFLTWGLARLRPSIPPATHALMLTPLSLNLWGEPPLLVLFISLWLVGLLVLHTRTTTTPRALWTMWLLVLLLPLLLTTLQRDFGTADTFEFQVTAPQMGIAHPTGYPLYLMLGKLWTLFPIGTVAARLNFGTMVYTLLTAVLIQRIMHRLFRQPAVAVLTAATFATLPIVWGQSIAAEVYTLHALLVAAFLYTLLRGLAVYQQFGRTAADVRYPDALFRFPRVVGSLTFLLGLGLTNHLTTVLLGATLLLFFVLIAPAIFRILEIADRARPPLFLVSFITFCLPLLLYFYLPVRWLAVNGDRMGVGRFIEWVTGSRFAGALQWWSFIEQPARYPLVGRLFLHDWGSISLLVVLAGIIALCVWRWRYAVLLIVTALVFTFYALNYHVPDLAVFIIPAHLVLALFWGSAAAWYGRTFPQKTTTNALIVLGLGCLLLLNATRAWHTLPTPATNPLRAWGESVLSLDLPENSVILADSDKFPPLYYLQQAENMRPDLAIKLLPDEAAYRAELDQQLANGRTVYLARYLPRLPYTLRSVGPLTQVAPSATVSAAPPLTTINNIDLLTADIAPISLYDDSQTAVTLAWRTAQPVPANWLVYLRWQGENDARPPTAGQHPVNNLYPTSAWHTDSVITDFYHIPRPILPVTAAFKLQLALAPAFTPADQLAWHTIGGVQFPAAQTTPTATRFDKGIHIGDHTLLGLTAPRTVRPNSPIPITLSGRSNTAATLQLALASSTSSVIPDPSSFAWQTDLTAPAANGVYDLIVAQPGAYGRCGYLLGRQPACTLAQIIVRGATLPATATNYADQFALLAAAITTPLTPGQTLDLTLNWQSLTATSTDYTVFVQLLDAADNIITQIDNAPVQGTFPTSQWQPGQAISDPYRLPIPADLPPGDYHLYIGFYNLRDLRRLPVLDTSGNAIDDKYRLPITD